jgi:hypothetical protein
MRRNARAATRMQSNARANSLEHVARALLVGRLTVVAVVAIVAIVAMVEWRQEDSDDSGRSLLRGN